MFGFKFKAFYTPFVLTFMDLLMGHSIMSYLIGYVAGHLYYYLVEVLPQQNGKSYLKTPNFIRSLFSPYYEPEVDISEDWSTQGHVLGRG